ncbi:mitochondrial carrier [Galdieria sulphuraria]|uniref:Mitochondrial carrier n=1 Tax=Galdieria sulphuraria TaxID=130081 RepID=M2VX08_GALSU|nr:mitochondrial carrier [Galdieria sulphuraria]EME27786.1 mitochondrial carrier [Galdieria sulphuraria]|eukprot:XP_005704306.1 mitochondrial carrier [Galdieria sulphuraria]
MSVVESFGISTKPKKQSALQTLPQNILFGGMAGVVGTSIIFPLYTLKTNLQSSHSTHSSSSSSRSLKGVTNILSVHHQWRVGAVVRSILGREGWKGFYRGLTPTLIGVAPEKAIKLSVNDMLCSFLSDEQGKTSFMNSIIAGAGAGFCQVIATCPMEMLMITFQTRSSQGQPIHSVTQLVKELGIRGIYKGLIATLCRDVPFSMIFFSTNAHLKATFQGSSERLAIPYVFVSGIGAGCLAAVLSTPMDVIKTRLQSSHSPYRGIVDCFVRTLHEDGITKFFSGSIARACIVSPLFGIALLFYEFQKRLASPS